MDTIRPRKSCLLFDRYTLASGIELLTIHELVGKREHRRRQTEVLAYVALDLPDATQAQDPNSELEECSREASEQTSEGSTSVKRKLINASGSRSSPPAKPRNELANHR